MEFQKLLKKSIALFSLIAALSVLPSCGPSAQEVQNITYAPTPSPDWKISTPEEQDLDPLLVKKLYYQASQLDTIYSLLLIKNGHLVAERYFNGGSVDRKTNLQSVTKSINAALVGIALEQGSISGLNQKMMDFFPELKNRISDPRKNQITIRQLLQMRAGYPWEESSEELIKILFTGFRPATILNIPLIDDPGTAFHYSNLSSHILGIILSRACNIDLKPYAQKYLFAPLGEEIGEWTQDWEGYRLGFAEIHLTARAIAKFGLLYINEGKYDGKQIIPAQWVHDSLQIYSKKAWKIRVGRHWKDNGYGYQWWSIRAGKNRYNLAWGHGGQQIALFDDMVIVVTADPLYKQHGGGPWKHEKANLNLVADFISEL